MRLRRCPVCEGFLEETRFQNGSPICRICKTRLREEEINYGLSERYTIRQAYTNLIIAIREQAEEDGELDEWQEFWLHGEPWSHVWELLQTTIEQTEIQADAYSMAT
jgi:reverse gyrase